VLNDAVAATTRAALLSGRAVNGEDLQQRRCRESRDSELAGARHVAVQERQERTRARCYFQRPVSGQVSTPFSADFLPGVSCHSGKCCTALLLTIALQRLHCGGSQSEVRSMRQRIDLPPQQSRLESAGWDVWF
jgi:hypothetical protein